MTKEEIISINTKYCYDPSYSSYEKTTKIHIKFDAFPTNNYFQLKIIPNFFFENTFFGFKNVSTQCLFDECPPNSSLHPNQ